MALPARRLFTVDEYYRMAETGILGEDDRVELIEGEIVRMSPIGPRHSGAVIRLNTLFSQRLAGSIMLSPQNPVRLGQRSEPQPDVVLLRPRADFYASTHPTPEDILLVIEVADSSVEYDLGRKARLYARHAIPELWVLDQRDDRLVVSRDPTPRGYATVQALDRGQSISPLAFPEVTFTVQELLG